MRSRHAIAPALAAALVLGACSGSPATPPPSGSATPGASEAPMPTAEPIPSDTLGELACELPVVTNATAPRANITDLRMATHEGYDRVVFEFAQGLPEITIDRATPPFSHDASGMPIQVDGASFLRLTMRGGTKQTEDGTSSYDGPTDVSPGFAGLVHLVEGGDFEAQSTWYFGLTHEACIRVLQLTDDGAPRLVIDIGQPGS